MVPVFAYIPFDLGAIGTASLQPLAGILTGLVHGNRFLTVLVVFLAIVAVCLVGALSVLLALGLKMLFCALTALLEDTCLSIFGLTLEMIVPPMVTIIPIGIILWFAQGVIGLAFGSIAGAAVVIMPIVIMIIILMRTFA